jgi:transcriptional regulator with XRE-family HTH domain
MQVSDFVNLPARVLAKQAQIGETSLSRFFTGQRNPSYSTIEKIATNLNMNPEDVLAGIRKRREKKSKFPNLTSQNKIA